MSEILYSNSLISTFNASIEYGDSADRTGFPLSCRVPQQSSRNLSCRRKLAIHCSEKRIQNLRTCKNCKTQFDILLNHPRACRYHSAHFGGETRRKFESVYSGGTMDTPDSGKVFQYWHCCGAEDPSDPGCTAAPHASYDD